MCVFTTQRKVRLAEQPLLCAFGGLTCLLQQAPGRGRAQGAAAGNAEGCCRAWACCCDPGWPTSYPSPGLSGQEALPGASDAWRPGQARGQAHLIPTAVPLE